MAETAKKESIWEQLRKPFDPKAVGKLPRGGVSLDYVGHAAVTDRLNNVAGPENWSYDLKATDEAGNPILDREGNLWILLTINGVTRPGVGDGRNMKERIGDALRNAAMRFGVALDLWTKDELESNIEHPENKNIKRSEPAPQISSDEPVKKETITKLMGGIKLKGIVERDQALSVLNNMARATYEVSSAADMTESQGLDLYKRLTAPAVTRETLEMLTEEG